MFNICQVEWLTNEVECFVQKQMADYLALLTYRTNKALLPVSQKVLRDAVWGNITLSASEIILLDAPVIQRLRKIGNLGLASFIFPGATHSRFEHTLGVTYVAGKMANALAQKYQTSADNQTLPLSPVELIRLAALFHDTGHIFYSHTGERYFSGASYTRSAQIGNTLATVAEHLGIKSISLGELLSALIITSSPIITLIQIAFSNTVPFENLSKTAQLDKASNIAHMAAELILGFSSKACLSIYTGIINGPIDADKCDYLARDALQTGVPVLFDLERLIDKLVPVTLPAEQNSGHTQQTLGIHQSALTSVEELTLSRRLMYEKVYYHPKVQTAETMLSEALRLIEISAPGFFSHFDHILRLNDHDLIHWEARQTLQDWAKRLKIPIIDHDLFLQAGQLLEELAKRQLFYRIIEVPESFLANIPNFADWCECEISPEVQRIIQLLGLETLHTSPIILATTSPKVTQITPDIWIDDTYSQTHYADHITGISAHVRNTPIWIVASENMAVYVIIAAEKQLWERYGLLLSSNDWQHLKVPYHAVLTIKEKLSSLGYYHDSTTALLPLSDQLSSDLAITAQQYMPVFDLPFEQSKEKLSVFLGQFRMLDGQLDLIDTQRACLQWLRHIPMLEEAIELTAIKSAYDQLSKHIRATRQPMVYLNHQPVIDVACIDLPPAVDFSDIATLLAETTDHLVFINNGALNIDDITQRIIMLLQTPVLSSDQQQKLRTMPIYVLSGLLNNAQASYSEPQLAQNIEYISGNLPPLKHHNPYGKAFIDRLPDTLPVFKNQTNDKHHAFNNTLIIANQFSSDSPLFLWQDIVLDNHHYWRALLPRHSH